MIMKKHLVLWLMMLLLLVAGCGNTVQEATTDSSQAPTAKNNQASSEVVKQGKLTENVAAGNMRLTLYFPTKDALYLQREEVVEKYNDRPATTAIELLIKGPKNKELVNVFPANTKLRGIHLKNGIAYVDFSNTILKNSQGGSSAENLMVASIVNTLTEFENIEKVQILVQGKVVDTLWGHVDVSEPLSRSEKIIKK